MQVLIDKEALDVVDQVTYLYKWVTKSNYNYQLMVVSVCNQAEALQALAHRMILPSFLMRRTAKLRVDVLR